MRILYNSVHAVLEYDEVKLLTELGHDVFSMGAYSDPKGHKSLPRPAIKGMNYYPAFEKVTRENPRTNLPKEFFDNFDIIINMHQPEFITENWDKMKDKKVVWRSIGQSVQSVENMIRRMRYEGLKIVRMSPMEQFIPDYLGSDAIIRFYVDTDEFQGWNGETKKVINFTQSLKARRVFCHHDEIIKMVEGFPAYIYGSGNDDLGPLNGGELPYDLMKGQLRDNRVFVYGGTWPSPYTLSLMEALSTGIPVVAIGKQLAEELPGIPQQNWMNYYEVDAVIENGISGFISNDYGQLRAWIHELLENHELAKMIGAKGREKAIEIFGKEGIKESWKVFLESL